MCCWCLYKKYRNSQSAIAQQLKWRNFTWMIQIQFQHHHWEHGWHWDAHLARKVLMHCEVPLYVCVYWNPQTLTCLTLKVIVTTCSELWKVSLASSVCVFLFVYEISSVVWHCWLGGRKGIWPVKTEWWGTGVVICLERGANGLHMVQLMPLPSHRLLLQ